MRLELKVVSCRSWGVISTGQLQLVMLIQYVAGGRFWQIVELLEQEVVSGSWRRYAGFISGASSLYA